MHKKRNIYSFVRKVCYRAKLHGSGTEWRAIHWKRIICSISFHLIARRLEISQSFNHLLLTFDQRWFTSHGFDHWSKHRMKYLQETTFSSFVSFEGNFISSLISLEKLHCREELDYLSKTGRRRSYRYLWQTFNASSTRRVLNRTVSPYTAALFSHGNSLDDTPELT